MPSSKFDDFKNGVDLVAEVRDQVAKKIYNLGLDVTTSERRAIEKARLIINDLAAGKLGHVKYFNGQLSHRRGETALPKVVIGLPPEQIVNLARSYLAMSETAGDVKKRHAQWLLNHPLRREILAETVYQLAQSQKLLGRLAPTPTRRNNISYLNALEKIMADYEKALPPVAEGQKKSDLRIAIETMFA